MRSSYNNQCEDCSYCLNAIIQRFVQDKQERTVKPMTHKFRKKTCAGEGRQWEGRERERKGRGKGEGKKMSHISISFPPLRTLIVADNSSESCEV